MIVSHQSLEAVLQNHVCSLCVRHQTTTDPWHHLYEPFVGPPRQWTCIIWLIHKAVLAADAVTMVIELACVTMEKLSHSWGSSQDVSNILSIQNCNVQSIKVICCIACLCVPLKFTVPLAVELWTSTGLLSVVPSVPVTVSTASAAKEDFASTAEEGEEQESMLSCKTGEAPETEGCRTSKQGSVTLMSCTCIDHWLSNWLSTQNWVTILVHMHCHTWAVSTCS